MDPTQALKCTALFSDLDSADLAALAARAVERRLKRGEILFMAGDPAGGLYVVVEGSIRAYRVSADGREQILHVESAGATLGEVPVFDEGCYPSTAAAEEDSTLLFIKKRDVLHLCLERPRISLAALKLLARRVRNCAALVESLSLRDVDRRLAQNLGQAMVDNLRLIMERRLVDQTGIEPVTSSMPLMRAPNCATGPLREDTHRIPPNVTRSNQRNQRRKS